MTASATALGRPSPRAAVIVRCRLPTGLERLRRRAVADAGDGLPAHVTLLYPFVAAIRLDAAVRETLAAVAAEHAGFDYRVGGPATWPRVVYATVDPAEPFVRLQTDLAAAFPTFPIYGQVAGFVYEPHITIAEGAASAEPAMTSARGWRSLPRTGRAGAIEVIVRADDGRWRTLWRIPLTGSALEAAVRMPA